MEFIITPPAHFLQSRQHQHSARHRGRQRIARQPEQQLMIAPCEIESLTRLYANLAQQRLKARCFGHSDNQIALTSRNTAGSDDDIGIVFHDPLQLIAGITHSGIPSHSTNSLSRPIRRLRPPASMYAVSITLTKKPPPTGRRIHHTSLLCQVGQAGRLLPRP